MRTCLEGRQSCYAHCSATIRCVYTARKASPTRCSVCMTPSQIVGSFCHASVRAFEEDRLRADRVSGCRSHRTVPAKISHWFSIDSPWRAILQREFFPLHNTAGFWLAFSLDYAAAVREMEFKHEYEHCAYAFFVSTKLIKRRAINDNKVLSIR